MGAAVQHIDIILLLKGKKVNCGNDHISTSFFVTPLGGLGILDNPAENGRTNSSLSSRWLDKLEFESPGREARGGGSDKYTGDGEKNGSQNTGGGQRKAAHRTLEGTQLIGFGGAHNVGGGAQRYALGNGMLQLEKFT